MIILLLFICSGEAFACSEDDLSQSSLLSYGSLIVAVGCLVLGSWRNRLHLKPVTPILLLVLAHPAFWMDSSKDCGAQLRESSLMFGLLAALLMLWLLFREGNQTSLQE